MTAIPAQHFIDHALKIAWLSPCQSKRSVVLWDPATSTHRGHGFNGQPAGARPGRAVCASKCGQLSVHAEVRARRDAARSLANGHPPGPYDLLHVELAADGRVVACSGPSCMPCAAQILNVGFVAGVWLYEALWRPKCPREPLALRLHWKLDSSGNRIDCAACGGSGFIGSRDGAWRRYTASEFYLSTARNCGVPL